jgi:hypothetical protein
MCPRRKASEFAARSVGPLQVEKETQALNAQDLQVLGDRRAHVLLYALKSSLNGKPTSVTLLELSLMHPAPRKPLDKS